MLLENVIILQYLFKAQFRLRLINDIVKRRKHTILEIFLRQDVRR